MFLGAGDAGTALRKGAFSTLTWIQVTSWVDPWAANVLPLEVLCPPPPSPRPSALALGCGFKAALHEGHGQDLATQRL